MNHERWKECCSCCSDLAAAKKRIAKLENSVREASATIIQQLAVVVRLEELSKANRPSTILREPVMQALVRIRAAVDAQSKAARALSSKGKER